MESWQYEYERSWRGFVSSALTDTLGKQFDAIDISADDRVYLASLLHSLGVRDHAAPQPSMYVRKTALPRTKTTVAIAAVAASATSDASCEETQVLGDSLSDFVHVRNSEPFRAALNGSSLSEASYVYSTPLKPCRSSGHFFPQFSSQDFLPEDPAAVARRESASQTLRMRMAGVSPIAPVRDHTLGFDPHERDARSSTDNALLALSTSTPCTGSPTSMSIPESVDAALLHPGDEEFLTPRPTSTRLGEQQQPPTARALLEALDADAPVHESCHAHDLDVSMQSMNLSDDGVLVVDEDDDRDAGHVDHSRTVINILDDDDDDDDPQEEHDDVPKVLYFSSDSEDDALECEFRDSHSPIGELDAEMDEATESEDVRTCEPVAAMVAVTAAVTVAVKIEPDSDDVEITAVVPPPPRALPTTVRHTATSSGRENNRNIANASRESCDSVDSIVDPAETPRPRALFQTKLPLEIEYRNAIDRRRRKQRRKSLLLRELGPYRMPEFRVELAAYQQRAVAWMHAREQYPKPPPATPLTPGEQPNRYAHLADRVQGGILADEMGLGKTVCCIALICESLKQSRDECRHEAATAATTGSATPRIRAPTLIVTPLSILNQWANEIRQKTNLSVITYHGTSRKSYRTAMEFMGADIVLSTYDTLRLKECKISVNSGVTTADNSDGDGGDSTAGNDSEWRTAIRNTPVERRSVVASKLHQLVWHRIILDESHLITNASCARARAACTLQSKRRWCVTGTPIQNSSSDLTSLVGFIGAAPKSDAELHALLPHVMLRRLKTTVDSASREPILALPAKTEEYIELRFASDLEAAFYALLHRSTKTQVLQYLQRTGTPPQFMHVFELLLRLRQTCDSYALVTSDPVTEVRGHGTLLRHADAASASVTPNTRNAQLVQRVEAQYASSEQQLPQSTKLAVLLTQLAAVKAKRERALVISQWTGFLDLIAASLERSNASAESPASVLSFGKLDGRMSAREREQVVAWFQQDRRLDVLLISLRTGGMGLNLTAASHVFLMEPSWNPSVESQAIDRAHRFGQTRPVRVVRFIMKSTIEERVVELQRKKRALATTLLGDATAGAAAAEETRLTRAELRQLFTQGGADEW